MHRDDWESTFRNQDIILSALKNSLDSSIFLAGGTGLHRHVLRVPYRHSEDLDFFFSTLVLDKEINEVTNEIKQIMTTTLGATLINEKKEKQIRRLFYSFEDNEEIVKVEILNFTCARLKDFSYLKSDIFRTENLYNLLLYKFKALCDRPDTIKDLFDIYFIMREMDKLLVSDIIIDINIKFKEAIGIEYQKKHIISSLEHNLKWDIEIGDHIEHLNDLKLEVEYFKQELKEAFISKDFLDFSYKSRIGKKALELGVSVEDYIEYIEENKFLENEYKVLYL